MEHTGDHSAERPMDGMPEHQMTAHTSPEGDVLWATCTCGWSVLKTPVDDDNRDLMWEFLGRACRAHVVRESGRKFRESGRSDRDSDDAQ